jgi:nitrate reductase gamma subunit
MEGMIALVGVLEGWKRRSGRRRIRAKTRVDLYLVLLSLVVSCSCISGLGWQEACCIEKRKEQHYIDTPKTQELRIPALGRKELIRRLKQFIVMRICGL